GARGIDQCAFSADSKVAVAVEHETDRVHVWNLEAGKELGQLHMKGTFFCSMALTRDGKTLAIACRPKKAKPTVQLWDVANLKELDGIPEVPTHVYEMSFSPDGKHLAVACDEGSANKIKQSALLFPVPRLAENAHAAGSVESFFRTGGDGMEHKVQFTIKAFGSAVLRVEPDVVSLQFAVGRQAKLPKDAFRETHQAVKGVRAYLSQ